MRCGIIAIFALIAGMCVSAYADGERLTEVKEFEKVSDLVTAVFTKTNAFFQGNLEFTMTEDKDKDKKKAGYTENAIGQMVPKYTVAK